MYLLGFVALIVFVILLLYLINSDNEDLKYDDSKNNCTMVDYVIAEELANNNSKKQHNAASLKLAK